MRYSLKYDIPFLPELILLGESMFEYIQDPGTLKSLDLFKEAVKRQNIEKVKIQCVGPATLLSKYSTDEAITRIYTYVSNIMDGLDAETILFLDEPSLGTFPDYNQLKDLWSPIFDSFPVTSGIHTCNNMDWDVLFDSGIDIVSFNASQYDIRQSTKYKEYRDRGGIIAWGITQKEDVKDPRDGDILTSTCGMDPSLYTIRDCDEELEKLKRIATIL